MMGIGIVSHIVRCYTLLEIVDHFKISFDQYIPEFLFVSIIMYRMIFWLKLDVDCDS